jgi:hypothetical protein
MVVWRVWTFIAELARITEVNVANLLDRLTTMLK